MSDKWCLSIRHTVTLKDQFLVTELVSTTQNQNLAPGQKHRYTMESTEWFCTRHQTHSMRISMAIFSTLLAMTPSVAKKAAWRSRGMTCVLIGSGTSPS